LTYKVLYNIIYLIMNIYVTGRSNGYYFKKTHGVADLLTASDAGIIEHVGNVNKAIASYSGNITVTGTVSELAKASDNGAVTAHGDTQEIRAYHSGVVTLSGNPGLVEATDNGSVVVFGEPKRINARHAGSVTIVTLQEAYEPDTLFASDNGSVRCIKPGTKHSYPSSGYLGYHLEKLYSTKHVEPLYIAYAGLLRYNTDTYFAN
jgi:hypothetical protein